MNAQYFKKSYTLDIAKKGFQIEKSLKLLLVATAILTLGITEASAELIGLYQFNDSSDLGKDTSGKGKNATNAGATYISTGYQDGAASFNGSTSYLRVNTINPNPSAMPLMTWGAWVKPDATDGKRMIVSADDGGYDRGITIDDRVGSTWSVFTGKNVEGSGITPSTLEWTFVAAVYNQPTNSMTFYVNDTSRTITSTGFGTSYSYFDIGHNPRFGEFFDGSIDNVFVYDEALSSTQIATIRATGSPVPEPSSVVLTGLGLSVIGFASRARKRLER